MQVGIYILVGVIILLLAIVVANIKIVPQSKAYVIERLGAYSETWQTGLHVKIPIIERVAKIVSLKEQVADFPPQPVITKDNVTMQIDTVVFFQITDPKLYSYGVEHPIAAHQHQDPRDPGRGHRSLGHQGEPRGAEEHLPAQGNSGRHGEADEGGA